MKTKATLIAVLLSATGTTFATGLSIDSVDESNITPTEVEITEIKVQGSLDAFNVDVKNSEKADITSIQQSFGSLKDDYDEIL